MQTITTVAMALALSADACAVSLTSGLLIKNIKFNKALKIALFFGGFQGMMIFLGWAVGLSFRDLIADFDHWIAFSLLSFLGAKMIYEVLKGDEENEKYNPLDNYTLLALAIATSIDAMAAGLGLSVLKISIISAATVVGLITFILSFIAVFVGHKFGNLLGEKIEIVGGIVLIGIGCKILLEHLHIV